VFVSFNFWVAFCLGPEGVCWVFWELLLSGCVFGVSASAMLEISWIDFVGVRAPVETSGDVDVELLLLLLLLTSGWSVSIGEGGPPLGGRASLSDMRDQFGTVSLHDSGQRTGKCPIISIVIIQQQAKFFIVHIFQ